MEKIPSVNGAKGTVLAIDPQHPDTNNAPSEQFYLVYGSIKPINTFKNSFREASAAQKIKYSILSTSLGLTAGYLSKKLFESRSESRFKKIIGAAIMFGVTNLVANNPEAIEMAGRVMFKFVRNALTGKDHGNNKHENN